MNFCLLCGATRVSASDGGPQSNKPRREPSDYFVEAVALKRLLTVFLLSIASPVRVLAESAVHIVIPEGAFGDYLAASGAIAKVQAGTVMRISFDYTEYDHRHPYLIAERFCGFNQFIRWGAATHPSLGEIDLVCVREQDEPRTALLIGGH
jgi:hypothetical protein